MVDGSAKFLLAKRLKLTETIARLRVIFGEFEHPRCVISDQGKAFTSKEFKSLMRSQPLGRMVMCKDQIELLLNHCLQQPRQRVVGVLTIRTSTHFSPALLMLSSWMSVRLGV